MFALAMGCDCNMAQLWPLGGNEDSRMPPSRDTRTNFNKLSEVQFSSHSFNLITVPVSVTSGAHSPDEYSFLSPSRICFRFDSRLLGGRPGRRSFFRASSSS